MNPLISAASVIAARLAVGFYFFSPKFFFRKNEK
jgi:hypothetical protein